MPKLLVLYPTPSDVAAFDTRYTAEHVPMARKIPGLTQFRASVVHGSPLGVAPYHRVAELAFASMDALQASMSSPEGMAVAMHAIEISTGGMPCVLIAEDDITE